MASDYGKLTFKPIRMPTLSEIRSQAGYRGAQARWQTIRKERVVAGKLLRSYLTAASKKNLPWELTGVEFVDLLCQNCYYCGAVPAMDEVSRGLQFSRNGIDRKDNGQGYTKENCVTACWNCNRAKGTLSYEEFLSWLKQVALFRK